MKPAIAASELTVSSSWKVVNDNDLKNCIIISDNKTELEETITSETCILLRYSKAGEPLTLEIKFAEESPWVIRGLSALCEARHLEVYGTHKEYIKTCHTCFMEKIDDDFRIYKCDVDLDKTRDSVFIKFLSLRTSEEMWLYGLNVQVEKRGTNWTSKQTMEASLASLQNNTLLSEKAKQFANLLQSGLKSEMSNLTSIESMVAKCAKSFILATSDKCGLQKNTVIQEDKTQPCLPRTTSNDFLFHSSARTREMEPDAISNLNNLVQSCFMEMEERLWCKFETHLKDFEARQNKKLDAILKTLQSHSTDVAK